MADDVDIGERGAADLEEAVHVGDDLQFAVDVVEGQPLLQLLP